jgi:hypothetical protein
MTHRRMPEEEWRRSTDHGALIHEAAAQYKLADSEVTSRKFLLLACACCRRMLSCLHGSAVAQLVGAAEQYAEGLAGREELSVARGRMASLVAEWEGGFADFRNRMPEGPDFEYPTGGMVPFELSELLIVSLILEGEIFAGKAILAATEVSEDRDDTIVSFTKSYHGAVAALGAVAKLLNTFDLFESLVWPRDLPCELVRDAFAFPRRGPFLDAWRTPTVVSLGRAAYDERQLPSGELAPDSLAVLSDALEESGFDDTAILDHLRSPGPHVRGGWALDLCLGLT